LSIEIVFKLAAWPGQAKKREEKPKLQHYYLLLLPLAKPKKRHRNISLRLPGRFTRGVWPPLPEIIQSVPGRERQKTFHKKKAHSPTIPTETWSLECWWFWWKPTSPLGDRLLPSVEAVVETVEFDFSARKFDNQGCTS